MWSHGYGWIENWNRKIHHTVIYIWFYLSDQIIFLGKNIIRNTCCWENMLYYVIDKLSNARKGATFLSQFDTIKITKS